MLRVHWQRSVRLGHFKKPSPVDLPTAFSFTAYGATAPSLLLLFQKGRLHHRYSKYFYQ
jgi:hypothetical protein